jgi:DNA-binding NarL/FixJ family response regulator
MTTIIIFEDDDQLRDSLVALIGNSNSNDYTVIGNYANAMDAATIVRRYKPDVVIMDIHMPGKTGIEGVREIKEARPQTFIIMYTMFENDESLFSSLCAGANGYILKKTSPFKLFEAINEVMEGGGAPVAIYCETRIAKL